MGSGGVVVFLHGIGVGPESWDAQLAGLSAGFSGIAPPVPGVATGERFTLAGSAAGVVGELDRRGIERAHLCGLSLGAMVALQTAVDHPDRVASLALSGGQVRPPRALMAVQAAAMRLLPARLVAPDGTDKQNVLDVLGEVGRMDLTGRLAEVRVPTLVLCGSRDRANLPAARTLAAGIPDAELRVVDGGGHELNTDRPAEFTASLMKFLMTAGPGTTEL